MNKLISAMMGFIGKAITATLIGSGILLFAGELQLATLKKAKRGATQLSQFTQRMTKAKLKLVP